MASLPSGMSLRTYGGRLYVYVDNSFIIESLKKERERIEKVISITKHTVKKKMLIKKFKFVDQIIGRMVFFDEDLETAVNRLKETTKLK